jgi:neutral ceramidase
VEDDYQVLVLRGALGALNKTGLNLFLHSASQTEDVSPNVLGTFCIDTGLPCDFNHSTCNGKNELCYGRGPGYSLCCNSS